ncbi:MAG: hypothetical protein Q8S39_08490 [Ignavibacteria bacterium]|nr:hypothetical protein [Ignavibacteria bacterium]
MKTIGLIIFAIGLIFTLYTGIDFFTKEKIVDFGSVQITKDKDKSEIWNPLSGVGVMIVGGVLFIMDNKKNFKKA